MTTTTRHPHDVERDLVLIARVHLGQSPSWTGLRALAIDYGVTTEQMGRALRLMGLDVPDIEWQARYEPRCIATPKGRVPAPHGPREAKEALELAWDLERVLAPSALARCTEPLIERIRRGEVAIPGPEVLKIARSAPLSDDRPPAHDEPAFALQAPPVASGRGRRAAARIEVSAPPSEPVAAPGVDPKPALPLGRPFIALDTETTGVGADDRVIWVALVSFDETGPVHIWDTPINPECEIPQRIQELTGIRPSDVARAPRFREVAHQLHQRLAGQVVVAHNLPFDKRMLCAEFARLEALGPAWRGAGWPAVSGEVCTLAWARKLMPDAPSRSLDAVAAHFGVKMGRHHRAVGDATVCGRVWAKMAQQLAAKGGVR